MSAKLPSIARGSPSALESAFYGDSIERLEPATYNELAEILRWAEESKTPVICGGHGAHAYLGGRPPEGAVVVSTATFCDVVRYEPNDLTIGVQAGVGTAELAEVLARNGQEIALDASTSSRGTVGGAVAAGVPGPRRASLGPTKSALIGIHAMRGSGQVYKAGGMVVKNVAGYEVGKFLVGSFGCAGVILEANFKLRSRPAARRSGAAMFSNEEHAWRFADTFEAQRLEPASLHVLTGDAAAALVPGDEDVAGAAVVCWRFEGNHAHVDWLESEIEELCAQSTPDDRRVFDEDESEVLLERLREFDQVEEVQGDLLVLRVSTVPTGAREFVKKAEEILSANDVSSSWVCDASAGQIALRVTGRPVALDGVVSNLNLLIRRSEHSAWWIYAPPEMRGDGRFVLGAERSAAEGVVLRRVLDVFDPKRIFCRDRILGSVQESSSP